MTDRKIRFVLGVTLFVILGACLGSAWGAPKYWVGDGAGNNWDTTSFNWTNQAPSGQPTPASFFNIPGNVTYGDPSVDSVEFVRDTPANRRNVVVQAGGVTPTLFRLDTQDIWNFTGGLINGPFETYESSGGGLTVHFTNYTASLSFSSVSLKTVNAYWDFAGPPGTYTFGSGAIGLLQSAYAAPFFKFTAGPTAGIYTLANNIICSNNSGNSLFFGGGAGKTNVLSGNILLARDLTTGNDGSSTPPVQYVGVVTVVGTRAISDSGPAQGNMDWTGATFTGANATNLTMTSDNGSVRGHILPSAGSRLAVGGLTIQEAAVYVNPTNVTEDYFATLRALGGKVVINGPGAYGNYLYLQNGAFLSSDLVTTNGGKVTFDTSATNRNLSFGSTFIVSSNSGPSVAYWNYDTSVANGRLNGDLEVGNGGTLALQINSDSAAYFKINGNVRLRNGSVVWRPVHRTARIQITNSATLYLGDGNPSTRETNTFRGVLINSGGPNEAWGFDVNTVADDGNYVLRYEGPDGTADVNKYNKYAISWGNAAGTVQAFRGGSAGTRFAPGTLPINGGLVAYGASPTVFTATSPTVVETPGLMTFSTTLPSNGTDPTPGAVLVTGTNATFDLQVTGRVWASTITVTNGAGISGIGTFIANVSVYNGQVAPGFGGAGTLSVTGNVTLATNSVLNYDLGTPGVVGGGTNDLLNVQGSLTLAGTVNVSALGGFGEGIYTLITYTNALVNNGLIVGTMPANYKGVISVDAGNKKVLLTASVSAPGVLMMVR